MPCNLHFENYHQNEPAQQCLLNSTDSRSFFRQIIFLKSYNMILFQSISVNLYTLSVQLAPLNCYLGLTKIDDYFVQNSIGPVLDKKS